MVAAEEVENGHYKDPHWAFDSDLRSESRSRSVETRRSEGGRNSAPELREAVAVVAAGADMETDLAGHARLLV